jgi:large subunit ribosomal protein L9
LKVILTKYHEKLGDVGDIVEVKSGYANNYLIPNGIVKPATRGNINQMKIVKQAALKVESRNIAEAEKLAKKLGDLQITFVVKTGKEGKLYGSITNKDIAEKIFEEKNIEIDKKKIELQEHIKELGEYNTELRLYKEIKRPLKIIVEPDEESKELIEAYEADNKKAAAEKKEEKKIEEEKPEEDKAEAKDKKGSPKKEKKEEKETGGNLKKK